MKKGYVFISNSNKPGMSVPNLMEIDIDNFSHAAVYAADKLGYKIFMGYNVDHPENLKCKQYDIDYFHTNIYRNIFAFRDNYRAYKILCEQIKEHPEIEIIHCNTPIGGLLGRLVGNKFNKKVIYMAHGFHFYKGAPVFNKTILKWIEQWLAHKTDVLVTINEEDYKNALKMTLKPNGKVFKVSGVGIDLARFNNHPQNTDKRESLGLSEKDFVCISLGDLNVNKNYTTVIDAIAKSHCKDIHYLICGRGPLEKKLRKQVMSLGIDSQIHFLGFRNDVVDLMFNSDCAIIPSYREGLPRTTMEAMAAGLPCVVSDIRGNRDLIDDGKGGFLVTPNDAKGFSNAITTLIGNPALAEEMGEYNKEKIKWFDIELVKKQMLEIIKNV